jgi:hypothetical protein
MGHNVPEFPRSALVAIRHAIDLALMEITLDWGGQKLLFNGWK